jgi:hypothetical protein
MKKKRLMVPMTFKKPYDRYDKWKEQYYFHEKPKDKEIKYLDIRKSKESEILSAELQNLDVERDILDDFTIVLVGRRRSGKSFAARHILHKLSHRYPCGVVITGTKLNKFWNAHIPKEFIHDVENMDNVLSRIFYRQRKIIEMNLNIDPRMFIILDDVLGEKYNVRFSKILTKVFTEGRHHRILTIITTQDPRGIPPDLRENTDLAIIFRQATYGRTEAVCKDYVDYIIHKNTREEFLHLHTGRVDEKGNNLDESQYSEMELEKFRPQTLCVLQSRVTNNLYSIFKKFIAGDPGTFYLGVKEYWRALHTGNYKILLSDKKHLSKKMYNYVARRKN